MNNLRNNFAVVVLLLVLGMASASVSLGQSGGTKDASAAPNTNPLLVDARQSGTWSVGIDPVNNTVRLPNSDTNPLAVKVLGSGSARKPFQFRLSVSPQGTGIASAPYTIPAGKRLVIENVSAVTRCPDGIKMEVNFFTYFDNGDGVGDLSDITFHRIALTEQGSFDGLSIASANHKVLVFADEQIGSAHFHLALQARLTALVPANTFTQAQVTFSGYIEDLPATP